MDSMSLFMERWSEREHEKKREKRKRYFQRKKIKIFKARDKYREKRENERLSKKLSKQKWKGKGNNYDLVRNINRESDMSENTVHKYLENWWKKGKEIQVIKDNNLLR